MKRLVFMVEGEGDAKAVPFLVKKLFASIPDSFSTLTPDPNPFRVGSYEKFTGRVADKWPKWLEAAKLRKNLGAVLLVIDGDVFDSYCHVSAAMDLAERAKSTGAGQLYSLGVVIIRQEFESMFLAVPSQLPGLKPNITFPTNVEQAPRGAKEWLRSNLESGYDETKDQLTIAQSIADWLPVRESMRSFRRLENSLRQLVEAVANNIHIVSPQVPLPPEPVE